MTDVKVERKGTYQGVPQWGITGSPEITPNRKTAEKWARIENTARELAARNRRCSHTTRETYGDCACNKPE